MPHKKRDGRAPADAAQAKVTRRRGSWPLHRRHPRTGREDTSPPPEEGTPSAQVYAQPQVVEKLAECYFYHTMDIPGYGHVEGEWDLRARVDEYLGGVDFAGKRVLEMGAASGFLTVAMESRGASVVAYDLSPEQSWDLVPMAEMNYEALIAQRRAHIGRINKGFWLNHRANQSSARMVHGTVYAVPAAIGAVDISTFCAILLHLRDPFLALQNALCLTRESVIITEMIPSRFRGEERQAYAQNSELQVPAGIFVPSTANRQGIDTWWELTPEIIRRFVGILGFEESTTTYHQHPFHGTFLPMYTVVGHRTRTA